MRKNLLIVAFVFFYAAGAMAQTTYGLKGGLNIATVRIQRDDIKSIPGFHAGGFVSAQISNRFALQPELLYSQQGYKSGTYNYRYHYATIPLIFKGTIVDGFHLQVGPQFGILIRANEVDDKITKDVTENLNQFDSAIALGLGYDLAPLHFSVRYTLGLSDTDEAGQGFNGFTNNVFQLSMGVSL